MPRVLIVDDNQQNLDILEMLLKSHGHEVTTACNGVEALDRARDTPPDILVSDILMPEMDGFALCRHWKADDVFKQRPFVFYTATYTDPKDEELALDLGADRFVCKPTKPEVLIRELEETLNEYLAGETKPVHDPRVEETVQLKEYNEALVRKLEDKVDELKSTNQRLEEQIAKLNAAQLELRVRDRAMAATPTGIVITDPRQKDNPIIYCNNSFERISGYRRDEILGKNCRFLQGNDRQQDGLSELRTAIKNFESCEVVIRNYKKGGSMFWNRLSISPVHDESGDVTHFVGTQEDITHSKRAEEAAKQAAIAAAQIAMLSPRENETLEHVVAGHANKVIARRMDIGEKMVEKHRSNLMKKLQVRSVPELVRLAMLAEDGTS